MIYHKVFIVNENFMVNLGGVYFSLLSGRSALIWFVIIRWRPVGLADSFPQVAATWDWDALEGRQQQPAQGFSRHAIGIQPKHFIMINEWLVW